MTVVQTVKTQAISLHKITAILYSHIFEFLALRDVVISRTNLACSVGVRSVVVAHSVCVRQKATMICV